MTCTELSAPFGNFFRVRNITLISSPPSSNSLSVSLMNSPNLQNVKYVTTALNYDRKLNALAVSMFSNGTSGSLSKLVFCCILQYCSRGECQELVFFLSPTNHLLLQLSSTAERVPRSKKPQPLLYANSDLRNPALPRLRWRRVFRHLLEKSNMLAYSCWVATQSCGDFGGFNALLCPTCYFNLFFK
jgi:hypothetical protein